MQLSFFDFGLKDQGGRKTTKFLNEMKNLIPFEKIEKLLIDKEIYKTRTDQELKKGGRPPIPARVLIGALFLQNWYNLSDPMTEEHIHDRISFRKFLNIKDDETIPDETTICKFRGELIKNNLFEAIFQSVKEEMVSKGLILNEGTLVDATLIHSSEPKRKKDENGKVISNKAADPDASYTSKRGRKFHGYKMHIATDTNGTIKDVITTTAKDHDSTQFETLTVDEKRAVFADSGYMSKARKKELREKEIFCGIVERRVRGQNNLRSKQQRNNKRFAKLRALVELPFARIKHHMNFKTTKYIGLNKNKEHFFFIAACSNLKLMPALIRKMEN